MKNIILITTSALFMAVIFSCNSAAKTKSNSTFNYDDLYKVWVVDTVIVSETEDLTTPNIEMDKNEYRFTKDGNKNKQGTRTTITSGASFDVDYTIQNGIINFDPIATFPLMKFDKEGNLISGNTYGVSLPPYEITELSPGKLTLKNKDILVKLKAK